MWRQWYTSSKLKQSLSEGGLKLVINVRSNMKTRAISAWRKVMMLSKRFIIETVNGQLKNICQLEH
ncbi:transposase [Pseudoalteromonas sp. A757]|uniref:transposase n=1 Tax=Pseudoalteromonas sp. A757 TaxID=2250709 RepID=UPI0031F3ACB1